MAPDNGLPYYAHKIIIWSTAGLLLFDAWANFGEVKLES